MSVKEKLNSAKLWQTISGALITAVASYFGYEQMQQSQMSHDVDIEVVVPAYVPVEKHTHPQYASKDWTDAIERADKRAIAAHKDKFH